MALYLKWCEVENQYMVAETRDDDLDKMIKAGEVQVLPEGFPIQYRAADMPEEYKTKVMTPKRKAAPKKTKTEG